MYLDLPVAHITIFIPYLVGLALFVGIISGLLGISGGFILTPLMIYLGIPPAIAVGSSSTQILASSLYASMKYYQEKRIPYRLAMVLTIGGVLGVLLGVIIFKYLSYSYNLDLIIKSSFIGLLLFVALLLLVPPPHAHKTLNIDNVHTVHLIKIIFIGFAIGIISGILGIGGGFLIVPALIYSVCIGVKDAVVISQVNVMFVSLISLVMHAIMNNNIDPILSIILVICGIMGTQIGLWFHAKTSEKTNRYIFACIVTVTACMLIYDLFKTQL